MVAVGSMNVFRTTARSVSTCSAIIMAHWTALCHVSNRAPSNALSGECGEPMKSVGRRP